MHIKSIRRKLRGISRRGGRIDGLRAASIILQYLACAGMHRCRYGTEEGPEAGSLGWSMTDLWPAGAYPYKITKGKVWLKK